MLSQRVVAQLVRLQRVLAVQEPEQQLVGPLLQVAFVVVAGTLGAFQCAYRVRALRLASVLLPERQAPVLRPHLEC